MVGFWPANKQLRAYKLHTQFSIGECRATWQTSVSRTPMGSRAKSVLKSHYARLTWQRDGQVGGVGGWVVGWLGLENCSCRKVELRGERKFAKCTGRTALAGQVYKPNRTEGLKWAKLWMPRCSPFVWLRALTSECICSWKTSKGSKEESGEKGGGGKVAEENAACTPAGKNEKFSLGQNSNCGF